MRQETHQGSERCAASRNEDRESRNDAIMILSKNGEKERGKIDRWLSE